MSNRVKVLQSLQKNGPQTYDDLEMATQIKRDMLRIAVNDAKKAGHLSMGRDDVTQQPAYKITPEGATWLKTQPEKKRQEPQAGSGDKTPAATDRQPRVAGGSKRADPPVEAVAIVQAPSASDDNIQKYALSVIRKALGIDHDEGIGIVPTIESLIESNDEWRKSADALDVDKTNALQALYAANERNDKLQSQLNEWAQMGSAYGIATPSEMCAVIEDQRRWRVVTPEQTPLEAAAIGYIVRVPKRKPRLCMKPERAVEAAQAAAKSAGRADVLALVPVGTARRKKAVCVEYTPAHQE